MELRLTVVSMIGSIALFLAIVELIRRGSLKEKYSLLWLATAGLLFALTLSKDLLDRVGRAVGIYYSPSVLFLIAFTFLLLISLQFALVISKLSRRNVVLTQELALLRLRVEELEAVRGGDKGAAGPSESAGAVL